MHGGDGIYVLPQAKGHTSVIDACYHCSALSPGLHGCQACDSLGAPVGDVCAFILHSEEPQL